MIQLQLQSIEQLNTIIKALEVLSNLQTLELFKGFDLALSPVLALKDISLYGSDTRIPELLHDIQNIIGNPMSYFNEQTPTSAVIAKRMLDVLTNNVDLKDNLPETGINDITIKHEKNERSEQVS